LPDVDIALENEKKRKLLKQQKEAEVLKAQKLQDKREAELQAREAKELEKKKEKEQQAREEQADRKARELAQKAEAKKQEAREQANEKEQEKRTAAAAAEKQKQAAADKQKAAAAAAASQQKQAAATAAASEKQHQDAVKRIMGMASAGNGDGPGGSSTKASGPSAGYAAKVRAKVLPNVVFSDDIAGNPVAEVRVTTTTDGTIMSQSLTKSSGNKAWDEAVIKAIIRTGSLPRDVDGQVPTPITLVFRPN